jgi:hypothetical protein
MKSRLRGAVSLLAITVFAVSTYGVDLKNADGSRYEVKITSGAMTTSTSIEGNTMQSNVCSDCEVEVVGVGKIRASGSETILIRDGKLSKQ